MRTRAHSVEVLVTSAVGAKQILARSATTESNSTTEENTGLPDLAVLGEAARVDDIVGRQPSTSRTTTPADGNSSIRPDQ